MTRINRTETRSPTARQTASSIDEEKKTEPARTVRRPLRFIHLVRPLQPEMHPSPYPSHQGCLPQADVAADDLEDVGLLLDGLGEVGHGRVERLLRQDSGRAGVRGQGQGQGTGTGLEQDIVDPLQAGLHIALPPARIRVTSGPRLRSESRAGPGCAD